MGRSWARCNLESDHSPRSITPVTDLGLLGLLSTGRSSIDQQSKRSHPNKAVDVVVCQTFRIDSGSRAPSTPVCLSAPASETDSSIVLSLSLFSLLLGQLRSRVRARR